MRTTPQLFGGEPNEKGEKVLPLHTYTIVDAINDKNVLPFRVDYIKTMDAEPDMDDKQVWDIDREKAFMAPKRISLVTKYILDHFDQKTYRGDKSYEFNLLTNVAEVASAQRGAVEEIKQKQRVSGFNSIFCVASVPMAKLYYQEFKKQMAADPTKRLRIATITAMEPMKRKRMAFWTRKTRKIPPTSTRAAGIFWMPPFRITTRCSIRTTRPMVNGSRITTKMYRSA